MAQQSPPNNLQPSVVGGTDSSGEPQPQRGNQAGGRTIQDQDASPDRHTLEPVLYDVERRVRESLAEHLRRCPYLPPSLADTLAHDVENAGQAGQSNGGSVDDVVLARFLNDLGELAPTLDPKTDHPRLPLPAIDHFIATFASALREGLIERHSLPAALADELIMHGRERALSRAMSAADPGDEIEQLVAALSARGAITPTLLLRALCLGRLHFFALAMAELAGLSLDEAKAMIYDGASGGLLRLYEKSELPPELFRAFRATIGFIVGLTPEQTGNWRREYTNRIIAHLVSDYDHVCPEDLEHVLSQLSRRLSGESEASGAAAPATNIDIH